MIIKKSILSILLISLLYFCSCVTTQQDIQVEEDPVVAQMVDDSEPVSFRKILVKIPYGSIIGKENIGYVIKEIKWESSTFEGAQQFKEIGSKILLNYGYNVMEKDENLFGNDTSSKARFQIAGIMNKIFFNVTYKMGIFVSVKKCDMTLDVQWQVYDSFKEEVVYKTTTTGEYKNPNDAESISNMVYSAFEKSLLRLLSDENFVHILTGLKESKKSDYENYVPIAVNYGTKISNVKIPSRISKMFSSVVTVQIGMTHGSGVIISPDGYILTAAHVVSGVDEVGVVLESGKKLTAKVLRINKGIDSALLKIKGTNFDNMQININKPSIGSEIFVIGTPIEKDLSYSVSKGIVSGYREKDGKELIQTDAAINPGNSGGPMINKSGQLIGIVSSKIVGEAISGIGFGIPVKKILSVLNIK